MARLLQAAAAAAAAVVLLSAAAASARPQLVAQSFARPERLDVESAIQNETRFQEAVACVLGDDDYRLCDGHTVGIKWDGIRMLTQGCDGPCSPDELEVYRFMAHVSHNKPEQWQQILDKIDPDGKYRRDNVQQWREHGIKV